ncbi:MAG: nicotinate-nucleotide--dimethylbenzimidazole phosphoribosyltransferase [Gammaproteobacteria bacterium]|nr:nicotinate-nucleotide--dimethylbenzimidazole phosphoribosyltransferase [Gammaproteobacteria bacterium]
MWFEQSVASVDVGAQQRASERQGTLTKPPGSLGRLESLAIQLAGLQGRELPQIDGVYIGVFAGDHGVADEGVSAFPQVVTGEMVKNFARGGAAISVMARMHQARLEVFNCGTVGELAPMDGVLDRRVAAGTQNLARQAAMSEAQLQQALAIGQEAVTRAKQNGANVFIAGEMGIANTTAATAVACALLSKPAAQIVGPGTGIDAAGVAHKAQVIEQALALHSLAANAPLEALRCVGGFEIAAMTGAYIAAAQQGMTIVVDGFIASASALLACRINAGVRDWMVFAHASAEPGHVAMMNALDAKPLLDLGMRLGEGSGAAVAVSLLQAACALHGQMATFAQAGVSEKSN